VGGMTPTVQAASVPAANQLVSPAALGRRRRREESGFTLAEVLVTVVIMGIAVVVLLQGLLNGISESALHRQDAVVDATLRDYAEVIKSSVLTSCPQPPGTGSTFTAASPAPSGYTASLGSVPPGYSGSTTAQITGPCPNSTQQLTLEASSNDGASKGLLSIVIAVP